MIQSMTGFGLGLVENEKISLSVQIKSVNGRFLESRFRMPREYSALEAELKKRLGAKIQRGTVDVSIYRTLKGDAADFNVVPNIALARGWMKALDALNQELNLGLDAHGRTQALLRVQDLVQVSDRAQLPDWEHKAVIQGFDQALEACLSEKKREGEELVKVFSDLLAKLEKFNAAVKKRKKEIDSELQNKVQDRLKAINESVNVDPNRLAQEVMFLLDKGDIAEEIARAETHIKAYREALKEKGSVGKKLEFYTQELHREFNTMGSKTQTLEVTLDIIDAKTNVERLREQVQNVE
jgi:uncharacterized protein (TIGR00255 family)